MAATSTKAAVLHITPSMMRLLIFCLGAVLTATSGDAAPATPRDFQEDLARGIVDLSFHPWSGDKADADVAAIAMLKPGIINRVGFIFGGPTADFLGRLAGLAARLRQADPGVRLGGGFPEALFANYTQILPCEDGQAPQRFEAQALTRDPFVGGTAWIDLGRPDAAAYYTCIGKIEMREGFSHFHFEEGMLTVRHAASADRAIATLRQVEGDLTRYGTSLGMRVSFSGDTELATHLRLDAVYMPSRFFIDDAYGQPFQNRVITGPGPTDYTYIISNAVIERFKKMAPAGVAVLFYVDNYDANQDDLRRFMELRPLERRHLIKWSALAAAVSGAVFIPPINHCQGCVPVGDVGDNEEIRGTPPVSEYDAVVCGDLGAIGDALALQRHYSRTSQ